MHIHTHNLIIRKHDNSNYIKGIMNKPNAICLPVGGLRRCVSPPCFPVQTHRITSMKAFVCWCALTPSLD